MPTLRRTAGILRLFLLASAAALPLASPAWSQQYAPNEVTVGTTLQTWGQAGCIPIGAGPLCSPATSHDAFLSAPTFTYTRNLSPSLALVGTFLPTSPFLQTNSLTSGRETLALGGVQSGWRGRRWGFFGELLPGVASFTCGTWFYAPKPYSGCTHLTNFSLEYGGVAEYRLSPRYALRLDAGHLEMTAFDHVLARYPNGAIAYFRAGNVLQHFDVRVGVTRSFGTLLPAAPERIPQKQTWDIGAAFAVQPRIQTFFQTLSPYPSPGLWASWNFSQHVSWDTTLLHSPRNPGAETIDFQAGGRALEILTGAKAGFRRDHMGFFASVRSGTLTFGKTERQINLGSDKNLIATYGMFTDFVLNTGGICEVYPSRHTILRFEAGNATIFYQPKSIIQLGQRIPIQSQTQPSMLMSFGAGLRF